MIFPGMQMQKAGKLAMESHGITACEVLLRAGAARKVSAMHILIRFPDKQTEQRALGKLIPRFSGKSWSSGELAVPSVALGFLADDGISFTVIGPAPYERLASLRDPAAAVL